MLSSRLFFLVLSSLSFFFPLPVYGLEELRVIAPEALKSRVNENGLIRIESPALFGVPAYREARSGILVAASPLNGCEPISTANWSTSTLPDPTVSVILLIEKGGCSFVTQVRHAQNAGAIAAIVYDNDPNANLTVMADDGTGKDIRIPSVLILNADGQRLTEFIRDNPTSQVMMSLFYRIPHPDNRVEWDLFTSSWDPQTVEFKEEMIPVMRTLDEQVFFTPHYIVVDGAGIGCNVDNLPCGKQCTHHGKYCTVDPERDVNTGIDGRDVILQDLREHCVFQYINATNKPEGKNQYRWFQFVADFRRQCYNRTNPQLWRNGDLCANEIMQNLNIDPQWISDCITKSGGADSNDTYAVNTLLQRFLHDRIDYGVTDFLPSFVNLSPYRGSYTCPDPIRNDGTCGVVDAICQGFATQPAACLSDKSCPFGVSKDACGQCGGDGQSCISTTTTSTPIIDITSTRTTTTTTTTRTPIPTTMTTMTTTPVPLSDPCSCSSSEFESVSKGVAAGIGVGGALMGIVIGFGSSAFFQYRRKQAVHKAVMEIAM